MIVKCLLEVAGSWRENISKSEWKEQYQKGMT